MTTTTFTLTVQASALPGWVPSTVGAANIVDLNTGIDDVYLYTGPWNVNQMLSGTFCAFSGAAYSRYVGQWGAMIVTGGGHSEGQDNSVFVIDLNTLETTKHFGPTALASDAAYEAAIASTEFCELFPSGQIGIPGSCHSYDLLQVIPPEVCSDPKGALIRAGSAAVGRGVARSTGMAHYIGLTADSQFARYSTNSSGHDDAGASALDTNRNEILTYRASGSRPLSLYRLKLSATPSERVWSTIPISVWPDSSIHQDQHFLAYNDTRDIWIFSSMDDGTGVHRVRWAYANDPTKWYWANLSTTWSMWSGNVCSIEGTNRVVFFHAPSTGPNQYYWLATIPADPANQWTVEQVPITGVTFAQDLPAAEYSATTFGRCSYAPALKSLIWLPGASSSINRFSKKVVVIRAES